MGWLTAIPFSFTLIQLIIFSLNKYRNMEYIHIEQLPKSNTYSTLLGFKGEDLVLVDRVIPTNLEDRITAIEGQIEGLNNILQSI